MIVAIDLGYGFVKAISSDGKKLKIPTWVAVAVPRLYSDVDTYTLDGVKYWLGEAALDGERIEINTIEELVKFYPLFRQHVLKRFSLEEEKVQVVTGLPPIDYFSDKGEELKAALKDIVLWQGFGILVDLLDELQDSHSVAVIDIGFNNIEYLVARRIEGKWLKTKVASIPHSGLVRAINIFKDILPQSLSFLKNAPKQSLILAFETKRTKHYGKTIDLSPYIQSAIDYYNSILSSIIESEIDISTLDKLIVAGGGAYYYKPPHKNVLIPPEPEFSNARGYIKWLAELAEGSSFSQAAEGIL